MLSRTSFRLTIQFFSSVIYILTSFILFALISLNRPLWYPMKKVTEKFTCECDLRLCSELYIDETVIDHHKSPIIMLSGGTVQAH